ncbi:MAG TPA: DUF2249 domain-containing protein [Longimicrobiales bacterium]|nr:DUF2249 domain-containing protein [Longimicrobiales bacterium]
MKLEEMMRRLRSADERRRAAGTGTEGERTSPMNDTKRETPAALAAIPESKIVQLDVREDLRNGQEPFSRIMAARREIPEGGALALRAIFEPVPLYGVMQKQGFAHWTEQLAGDDWRVWFYPEAPAVPAGSDPTPAAPGAGDAEDDVRVLDVRDLEPPEPMLRTLAALAELPAGATLVQLNARVPQFLLPQLAERGFTYEIREQEPGVVRLFIRHASP